MSKAAKGVFRGARGPHLSSYALHIRVRDRIRVSNGAMVRARVKAMVTVRDSRELFISYECYHRHVKFDELWLELRKEFIFLHTLVTLNRYTSHYIRHPKVEQG